jgi:hypothetical protein
VGGRLGFGLADGLCGGRAARLMVQKFVRQSVREHGGMLGGGHLGQQSNLPAFGDAPRGSDGGGKFEPDAERKRKRGELLPVVAGIALDSSDGRERFAFGLRLCSRCRCTRSHRCTRRSGSDSQVGNPRCVATGFLRRGEDVCNVI